MPSSRIGWLLLLAACGEAPAEIAGIPCSQAPPSGTGVSFDPHRMTCAHITLADADFEALCAEYRFEGEERDQWPGVIAATALSCSEPYPADFTTFSADISVDGWHARGVGVRKKGFIGSTVGAGTRPSLKVKTDAFVAGQRLGDTERVTLNNNLQDLTRMRTCLAYSVFEDAGYPAPRCSLANVSVNGVAKGTYAHVESLKKDFLRHAFGNDDGSLYEGTLADFTDAHLAGLPDNLGRFEAKTDDTDPTGARLRDLADALRAPDAELESALDEVLDVQAFLEFWALETLIQHDDGYNANTNNFFVYFDPARGDRAVFVPWGADDTMSDVWPWMVTSELARRLSRHPELGPRFLDTLQGLVDEVWDEERLLERIDAFAALVATAEEPSRAREEAIDRLRTSVGKRRKTMAAFLEDGGQRGDRQPGPCTGSYEPADFLMLAEVVTTGSTACATGPRAPVGALFLLCCLLLRQRKSNRGRSRSSPGRPYTLRPGGAMRRPFWGSTDRHGGGLRRR